MKKMSVKEVDQQQLRRKSMNSDRNFFMTNLSINLEMIMVKVAKKMKSQRNYKML